MCFIERGSQNSKKLGFLFYVNFSQFNFFSDLIIFLVFTHDRKVDRML